MKSGKSKQKRRELKSELGKRDRRILSDVIRYRLTTTEFIHSRYLSQAQSNAVVKITSRLTRQSWLRAYQLLDRQQYFVAGPSLLKLYGLPASRSRPLGPQSLATAFSIMKYCATSPTSMELATEPELLTVFPWMDDKLLSNEQAIDNQHSPCTLRLIRADLGGTPDHVAKKCMQDVSSRQSKPEFNQLVADKRFVLVILTPSVTKQELIQKAIAKKQWPPGMRFQIFVVPELTQFLAKS